MKFSAKLKHAFLAVAVVVNGSAFASPDGGGAGLTPNGGQVNVSESNIERTPGGGQSRIPDGSQVKAPGGGTALTPRGSQC